MVNLDTANETDVREEIAQPFLVELGYQRGTNADILREYSLSYGKRFLGRKKLSDPPIRGRADYILSVLGVTRWVLEIKAPSEEITRDVIEQAISYAKHPEISAFYAAILNGRKFVLYYCGHSSTDEPACEVEVESASILARKLFGILSPSAIRRDCRAPKIDLQLPLADGFRSSAAIKTKPHASEQNLNGHFSTKTLCGLLKLKNYQMPNMCRLEIQSQQMQNVLQFLTWLVNFRFPRAKVSSTSSAGRLSKQALMQSCLIEVKRSDSSMALRSSDSFKASTL